MGSHWLAFVLTLGVAHACAGAAPPATRSSTSNASAADACLDAAREDLRALAKRPAAEKPWEIELPELPELAMALVQRRGSAADRALLRDLLGRVREITPRDKGMDDASFDARVILVTAGFKLRLADPDAAAAIAIARERWAQLPDGPTRSLLGMALSWWLAEAGDYDQAVAIADEGGRLLGDRADARMELALVYAGEGRADLRDRALQEAVELLQAREDSERESGFRRLARRQASLGLFADANATAARIKTSWKACDTYVNVAEAAAAAGEVGHAEDALAVALRIVEGEYGAASGAARIATTAEEIGAPRAFAAGAAVAEKRATPSEAINIFPALARGYAAFNRPDDYRRAVELAKAAIAALPADDASRNRPGALLQLASAHARAGEHGAVDALIAQAGMTPEQHSAAEYFPHIPAAYAARGDFARALAVIEAHLKPDDRWFELVDVAESAARAGRFDVALDVARRMRANFFQQRVYRFTARAQAKAGQAAAVEAWVKDIPSPHARAVVRLGVAEQLLGVRPHLSVGLYKD